MGQGSKLATYKKSTVFLQTPESWSILPSHKMVILTKVHDVWRKIVYFSLVANSEPCPILTVSPCNFLNDDEIQLKILFSPKLPCKAADITMLGNE